LNDAMTGTGATPEFIYKVSGHSAGARTSFYIKAASWRIVFEMVLNSFVNFQVSSIQRVDQAGVPLQGSL